MASQVSSPVAPTILAQNSYAGLGRRVAAHLVDALVALALIFAGGFFMRWLRVLGVWTVPSLAEGEADPLTLWHRLSVGAQVAIVVAYIVQMGTFYSGFFQASAWQASIGKRLLHIYVTDMAGRRMGLTRSLARSFAKDFFSSFYIGFISVAMIIAAPEKRALHDLAAKTVVVNGRPAGGRSLELWHIVAGVGIQFLWFVVTMVAVFRTQG